MKDIFETICEFLIKNFEKFIIVIVVVFPLLISAAYLSGKVNKAPVREDAVGYYAYLPAAFFNKDLTFNFMISEDYLYTEGMNTFERRFNPDEAEIMGFHRQENGKYLDKYPVGVAILLIPFFILGHILTILFNAEPTGWSFFYQYCAFFGGVTYFLLGLLFLKRILKKHFSSQVTLFTLVALVFGTNLFNYATYENIFSHVYSFFLITLLLYLVPKWLKSMNLKQSILIGLNIGLILLVRQINVIFALLVILFGVNSFEDVSKRVGLLLKNWRMTLLIGGIAFIILIPQFLYWKFATGSWIAYSYGEEGFLFLQPKLINVLFGSSKGLFFWSPILLFSIIGVFNLKRGARKYFLTILVILVLQVYIVSSWWNWEFGWSFGHRAFTDSLGLFAIGLAGFYASIKKYWVKVVIAALSMILILLSIFQMVQYWLRILPPARTTLDDYAKIFLRLDKDLVNFWGDKFK